MDLERKMDHLLDRVEAIARALVDSKFDETWFNWLGWVTISGAIFGVARQQSSFLLYLLSAFSAFLLFFKTWFVAEAYIHAKRTTVKKNSVSFLVLILVAGTLPLATMIVIGNVFMGLVQK